MAATRKQFIPWVWLQLASNSFSGKAQLWGEHALRPEYDCHSWLQLGKIHTMSMAATRKQFAQWESSAPGRARSATRVRLQLGDNSYHEYGCNSETIHTMSMAATRKQFIQWESSAPGKARSATRVRLRLGDNSNHEYGCNSETILP